MKYIPPKAAARKRRGVPWHGPLGALTPFITYNYNDDKPHKVPEPATMLLFASGLLGVAGLSRLRRFNKKS